MMSRSQKADEIIISLQSQIEEIKSQAPLPVSIQETILKQENAQLRNFFTVSIYTHKLYLQQFVCNTHVYMYTVCAKSDCNNQKLKKTFSWGLPKFEDEG